MSIRPFCCVVLLACSATAGIAQSPAPATMQRVDSMVAAEFAKDSIASLTIGVVTPQGLIWTKSYGYADMATKRLANRQSVYRIGSITKMFTALMLQQLVAAKKIQLTDPVERYYPEIREIRGYKELKAPITVAQLATMTAGIAREPEQEGPFWTGPVAAWDSTLHLALSHTQMDHAPGGSFLYSNIGYAILGATLGRAAGVPYVVWEQQHVFDALGMSHTAFEIIPSIAPDVTRGYDVTPSGDVDVKQPVLEGIMGRGFKVPNGAIFTTVDDLSRFLVLQLGYGPPSVVPKERLDSAFNAVIDASGKPTAPYGIGFSVEPNGRYGHGGAVAGYTAAVTFDRRHQVGVIVLRNALGGRVNASRIADTALQQLVNASPAPSASRPD